jgi:hypothetical protein
MRSGAIGPSPQLLSREGATGAGNQGMRSRFAALSETRGARGFVHPADGNPGSARNRALWECSRRCSRRRGGTVRRPDGGAAVCGHVVDLLSILARLADRSNGKFSKWGKNSAVRFSRGLFWGFRTPFAPQKSQKSRPKSGGLHDRGRRFFPALDPTVGRKKSQSLPRISLARSHDCVRARTLASNIFIFGASGSPARMNPWPAPS